MEKFFTVDGSIFSVNQDCTLTQYATISEAFASNSLCVIQSQLTYENMLVRGRNEQWYQNTKYSLYEINSIKKADRVKIGRWAINGIFAPRGSNTLHCNFIDPFGKVLGQILKGPDSLELITQAFSKVREMNNYESGLNYELMQENLKLRQEIDLLKIKLASHVSADR